MAIILDGKALAAKVKEALRGECDTLKAKGIHPALAVIIAGDDPASRVYVNNKKKDCAEIGIRSEEYAFGAEVTEKALLDLIGALNENDAVHGILVQLPLPRGIDEKKILLSISPGKDVDAFHPVNVGKIMIGNFDFLPCTPAGVMDLIALSGVAVEGKECVVVGRSNIVGKPQAMLLLHENGTVTICHSKTKNLREVCLRADILVAAVGRPRFITADMVKEGAVVIDVGMNTLDGKLCGDVDFDKVSKKAFAITPVPGGVGPMTRAILMKNTVKAASLKLK